MYRKIISYLSLLIHPFFLPAPNSNLLAIKWDNFLLPSHLTVLWTCPFSIKWDNITVALNRRQFKKNLKTSQDNQKSLMEWQTMQWPHGKELKRQQWWINITQKTKDWATRASVKKAILNSVTPETFSVSALLMAPIVLLLVQIDDKSSVSCYHPE